MPSDILILDGYYLAYKAHFVAPPLKTSQGFPTGIFHTFLGSITRALKAVSPRTCVVALEGDGEAVRSKLIEGYKANREPLPPAMRDQLPLLWDLCTALGWTTLTKSGYEADDVICSIVRQTQALNPAPTCCIYTVDKDILSLLTNGVTAYQYAKGQDVFQTEATLELKWGVKPYQIPEVLSLCGDDIDEIPGLPTIGRKTAVKLIQAYGTAAEVYNAIDRNAVLPLLEQKKPTPDRGTLTLRDILKQGREQWVKNRQAVELMQPPLAQVEWDKPIVPNMAKLTEILSSLEMYKTLEKLQQAQIKHPELNLGL